MFATTRPIFTEAECDALVSEARAAIAEGLVRSSSSIDTEEAEDARGNSEARDGSQQQRQPTNSDLGEVRVSTLPGGRKWLRAALRDK